MNSDLFELCKKILFWWDSVYMDEYHGKKPMPEFVSLALQMVGGAIVNVEPEDMEEISRGQEGQEGYKPPK